MIAKRIFPMRGYVGLAMIAIGWPLAWGRPSGLEFVWENAFLLLWVGYALVVDGLNLRITGTSLYRRNRGAFIGLFILSIPMWWLFEFFNIFLGNWHYMHNRSLGMFEFAVRSSIHFSIVMPVVLSTAELWASSSFLARASFLPAIPVSRRTLKALMLSGIGMLVLVMAVPRFFFPLVWICLYLITDSVNMLRGAPSLLFHFGRGNWRPAAALALGALTCGFFWEMWNFYALPKWTYAIPFFDFFHVFEMPLLGYLGYLPFGLEVYALYIFIITMCGLKNTAFYGGERFIRL
jgi:hypothetical protein